MPVKTRIWDPVKTADILALRFNVQASRALALEGRQLEIEILPVEVANAIYSIIAECKEFFNPEGSISERIEQVRELVVRAKRRIEGCEVGSKIAKNKLHNLQLTTPNTCLFHENTLNEIVSSTLYSLAAFGY